jgi:hypothetical protein
VNTFLLASFFVFLTFGPACLSAALVRSDPKGATLALLIILFGGIGLAIAVTNGAIQ